MNGEKLSQMFSQDPTCQCGFPVENRIHQLLDCSMYNDIRQYCISRMTQLILTKHNNSITSEMIQERKTLVHLILDPSWFRVDIGSIGKGLPNILSKDTADRLEQLGRTFCYQLYRRRLDSLSELDESDDSDESNDSENYSIHDTSEDTSTNSDASSEEDFF